MKFLLFLLSMLFIGTCVNAQSSFKTLPKLAAPNRFAHATTVQDSTMQAWRFIADIAAYSEPGNIAEAGVGYGYQWLKYDYTSQKWTCQYSVSAVAFAGGSVAPSTPASIVSAAIMAGFDNNLFLVGPQYNFGTKQFGVAISIGINLNN